MTHRPSISRYMTPDPMTLSPDMEITRAAGLLVTRRISGAPVVDEAGRLVGMLTAKDCFAALMHASYHQELGGSVSDYMTGQVETMEADTDIIAAARRFSETPYRRFPVMDEGRLVGIITRNDLLAAFTREYRD